MKKKRLGEVLRERGHISTADLNQILLEQRGKRLHLGELLLQRGKVAKIDLVSALAEVSDVPYLDCTRVQVEPEALKRIPHAMAKRCSSLPIGIHESPLRRPHRRSCHSPAGRQDARHVLQYAYAIP